MATGGVNLSGEFFELLKAIGESKSKQEEDRIIAKEVHVLKTKLEHASTSLNTKKKNKEFMVRLLYVEMLGHDGSFGYMRAVEFAASSSVYHKRTGYLVCGCCLPPTHEFRFMLVNQMQRDLQSANVLECCGGLLACTTLLTADMVPAVATEVSKLVGGHDHPTVRKKAILCLHKLYQLAPEVVGATELRDLVRKTLCDTDPAVMGSCLNVIYGLSLEDPGPFKDLVPSLVSILKQINERRLPSEYDYHRVPAPWMQLMIVRILGVLGKADRGASSGMYEILSTTLKAADTGINAGYAIVYECVKTIVSIYPNATLMDTAAQAIARFIDSRSHNLKYLGVTGLAWIVEQSPAYAAQHQLAVMDCLEDPDETLQRKTLDLLYRMTNPVNVEFIADKLIEFLSRTQDQFLQKQLTGRVSDVAERYAPNNVWYIKTVTKLLTVSGDMVDNSVAATVMNLLAEGTGESEEQDMLLRQTAIELYVDLLLDGQPKPRLLLETMAWSLGEYGYLSAVVSLDTVISQLCAMKTEDASTRRFVISAICKLVAQAGHCPPAAAAIIEQYTQSADPELQQRCCEFQAMLTSMPAVLPTLFPVDASAEDVQIDDLSCLDGIVASAVANGARRYDPSLYDADDDDDDDDGGAYGAAGLSSGGFKMTPYEKPTTAPSASLSSYTTTQRVSGLPGVPLPPGAAAEEQGGAVGPKPVVTTTTTSGELSLNTRNVANVWGKGGLAPAGGQSAAAAAAPPYASGVPPNSSAWGAPPPAAAATAWQAPSAAAAPPPPSEPVKTAAQIERERQAAALFGGIVPGAAAPAQQQPAAAAVPAPAAPVPAPAPPPAPAPAVDLLDMGGWDDPPATSTGTSVATPPPTHDTFAPPPASEQVVVETVSDDADEAPPPAAAAPVPASLDIDPFASAGLLGDNDQPLPTLMQQTQKFEYQGTQLSPWTIATPEFGQHWTTLATAPSTTISAPAPTIESFTSKVTTAGANVVQIIGVEAICAAAVGSQKVLVHSKANSGKVDVTVKCTDAGIAAALALYLQNMMGN